MDIPSIERPPASWTATCWSSAAAPPARWPRSPPPSTAPRCCCWRRPTCGTPARWRWAWTASTTPSSPARPTPEDYVAEITRANDGIVNQRTIYQTATRGFAMVQRLERYGVKFEKDEHGEYAVRRVHRSGSYVLPMPEGKDVKKALYRVLRQRDDAGEDPDREPADAGAGADRRTAGPSARPRFEHPHRRVRRRRGQGRDPGDRRLRAARAARVAATCTAPTRTRPTPATATRWPTTPGAELSRHRVLPDQPADQGLQRPGLRLRRQPVRRLPGQRRRASGSSTPTTGRAR